MNRYRLPAIGLTPTQSAELDGFHAGRHDFDRIGWCKYLYQTPAEVQAWLAGWHRGQEKLWREQKAS